MIRRERQANSVQGRLNSIFRHIPGHIKMRNSVDGTIKTAGEWGLYYKQRNDHSTAAFRVCHAGPSGSEGCKFKIKGKI